MKIIFVGDSPTLPTGFAKCTRELCDRLHANGHEVNVLGISYYGDKHDFPYDIYPCVQPLDGSRMIFGEERLPKLVERLQPDFVIILQDPWNIRGYFIELVKQNGFPTTSLRLPTDPQIIGWLAVDSKNQRSAIELNLLDYVVTWTQFGIDELVKGGYQGEHSIIGLGVDSSIYYPTDRIEARWQILGGYLEEGGIPIDSFIIGVVGRNQVRKRLDLNLEYFAEWSKSQGITDAYLCLHVGPTGENGCDIERLCAYYGIKVITLNPPLGKGVSESEMRSIYNMFDVFWSMSQAEGWNLPALEAMACGVPCILPDQGAHSEWAKDAAYLVPCTSTALTAPVGSASNGLYTVGGIADRHLTIGALDKLYRWPDLRRKMSRLGLDIVYSLSWDRVGGQFESLLQTMLNARTQPTMTNLMTEPEAIDEFLELDQFAGALK